MKNKRKRLYAEPAAMIVWLRMEQPLLSGSGNAELGGYGDAIGEGDSGGWKDNP